ncbi:hypothetical protein EEL32_12220 [Brevibacillus laterosporus]|nr:hypothetical protein [Brevibacillus laterosporus]TPG86868.1 hypothetical protein EEL32_12220 [Brevibacillus laterosporus]
MKKTVLSLSALALLLSSVTPVSAFAMNNNEVVKSSASQDGIKEKSKKLVDQLEKFVIKNADGTLSLDEAYKEETSIPKEFVDGILEWMDILNEDIREGELIVGDNLEIMSTAPVLFVASKEIDYEFYWWGVGIYIGNKANKDLVKLLLGGAMLSEFTELILEKMKTPLPNDNEKYKYIIKVIKYAFASGATILGTTDEGNGVLISLTYPGYMDIEAL